MRFQLAHAVKMRHVPEIHFHYDDSVDRGERIDRLGMRALQGGRAQLVAQEDELGLVAGQVALTLVVLAGAALLMKSLLNLQRTDPGFVAEGRIPTTQE